MEFKGIGGIWYPEGIDSQEKKIQLEDMSDEYINAAIEYCISINHLVGTYNLLVKEKQRRNK